MNAAKSTAAPVAPSTTVPLSTAPPAQPQANLITSSIFGDSVFESQRTQTGVSVKSNANKGINAIVSEAPTKDVTRRPVFTVTPSTVTTPTTTVSSNVPEGDKDGLIHKPFSFSFDTLKNFVPSTTPEPTEVTNDGETVTATAPIPTAGTQSFGSFRIDHSDHPSIVVNEGELDETQTSPILLQDFFPKDSAVIEPETNSNGNENQKPTLAETLLNVLNRGTSENIVAKQEKEEVRSVTAIRPVVNAVVAKDDIIKKPLDPQFHIQLGPHVVDTVKRPKEAKEVEESIHKTYDGQEFVGEDTLKSFGNETTVISINVVKTKRQTDLTEKIEKTKTDDLTEKTDIDNKTTLEDVLFDVLSTDDDMVTHEPMKLI